MGHCITFCVLVKIDRHFYIKGAFLFDVPFKHCGICVLNRVLNLAGSIEVVNSANRLGLNWLVRSVGFHKIKLTAMILVNIRDTDLMSSVKEHIQIGFKPACRKSAHLNIFIGRNHTPC